MSRILIIDDDQAVRGLLRQRLEGLYDIADTGKPEDALAMALQFKPDCILLDLMMPKFSGSELCQTLASLSYTRQIPILIVYNASAIGSIYGGYLPESFIRIGLSAQRARVAAMLLCACLVAPVFLINYLQADNFGKWAAIGLLSLATAAHQGFSANLFTTASDMFPRSAVGSVTGIGTMTGAVGGFLFAKLIGHMLQITNSYSILFIIAASVYLLSLLINVLLAPGLKKVELTA